VLSKNRRQLWSRGHQHFSKSRKKRIFE